MKLYQETSDRLEKNIISNYLLVDLEIRSESFFSKINQMSNFIQVCQVTCIEHVTNTLLKLHTEVSHAFQYISIY